MITIFKVGDMEYPDAGLNKPVRYTIRDLEQVASKTSSIDIKREHSDEILGNLSNFIVKDGCLKADEPEGFDLKGFGLSPEFETELVDMGDYYAISTISMGGIGLTKNPRNKILYNSISVKENDTGVNMGESALEKVIREKDDLQKQIGVYENSEKQYKKLLKQKEDEIKRIKESSSGIGELENENKALKEKADAYDAIMESRKTDLIHQIAGDDENLAKEYESFSVEHLETVLKSKKVSTPRKGITPQDVDVDDGNDPLPEDNDEEYTDEMFEAEFKASGL